MTTAAALLCALLPAAASAALTATASLSDDRLFLGDQVVLSVTITGSSSASPRIPPIPDVELYESGRSQSVVIQNGSVASSVVYTYVLAPRKTGRFRVPPIETPGAPPTAPIDFEVAAAGAAPAPPPGPAPAPPGAPAAPPSARRQAAPDAFVTASLQKTRAFVNEPVALTVRFLTSVPLLGRPQYDSPKLVGLMSEETGAESQGTTSVGGRVYTYSEIKSVLYPVQSGRATVGPATVTVQMPRRGATGDDFFDRFFGMTAPETRRLTSEPLVLHVEPLPPGKPDDFSGVVGRLSVDAAVDRTKVKAGEAVTLTVNVRGAGNLKSLPEPKRPDLPAARFFDTESSAGAGVKTFRTVLVPRVSGPLEIPPASVSYLDPDARVYRRAESAPIRIDVLPGEAGSSAPLVAAGQAPAPGVTAVSEDIRYLKAPGGRSALGDALAAFGAAGPWHVLPFAFFLAAAASDWRRRRWESDPRARRARQARSAAERRLRRAEAEPEAERAKIAGLLAEALTSYLADKLGAPAAGLTLREARERLESRGLRADSGLPGRVKAVWEELELLRFAPGAAGGADVKRLIDETRGLIAALDKDLPS